MSNKLTSYVPYRNYPFQVGLLLAASLLLLWLGAPPPLRAQGDDVNDWSRPIDLSDGTEGKNSFPTIIADGAGGVHVFWDESVSVNGGLRSWVDYAYWDGRAWSEPLDVFVGSVSWGNTWGAQAVVDRNGIMHTIWIDGFELKYAQRHVSSPVSARSWTHKQMLPALRGRVIGPAAIAIDDASILHVVYLHSGAPEPGVYYLRSKDGGKNWETPLLLSERGWYGWSQNQLRYVVDVLPVADTLHVVWDQEGLGLVYSQGRANGQEWSYPEVIPQAGIWPSLVAMDNDRLLLFTTGTLADGGICLKLQNLSLDSGRTWFEARRVGQPAKGCLGRVNVMSDGDGGYHMVVSGRIAFDYQHVEQIWYADGIGVAWNPAQLVSWPGVPYESLGTQPDFPRATISEGNLLHVVFHTDTGQIWYTRRSLSASPLQPRVYPTPTIIPTATPDSEADDPSALAIVEPTPSRSVTPLPEALRRMDTQSSHFWSNIPPPYIGGLASALLVGLTLVWNLFGRKR